MIDVWGFFSPILTSPWREKRHLCARKAGKGKQAGLGRGSLSRQSVHFLPKAACLFIIGVASRVPKRLPGSLHNVSHTNRDVKPSAAHGDVRYTASAGERDGGKETVPRAGSFPQMPVMPETTGLGQSQELGP